MTDQPNITLLNSDLEPVTVPEPVDDQERRIKVLEQQVADLKAQLNKLIIGDLKAELDMPFTLTEDQMAAIRDFI